MLSPHTVRAFDPVAFQELGLIRKIIADETWLEGERRGCTVSPFDPVVRENVCQVILRVGAAMRAALEGERGAVAEGEPGAATLAERERAPGRPDFHPHAA